MVSQYADDYVADDDDAVDGRGRRGGSGAVGEVSAFGVSIASCSVG